MANADVESDLPDRGCRFCGLPVVGADWHPDCVGAPPDTDRPKPGRGHPMYGPRPGPYFNQQG